MSSSQHYGVYKPLPTATSIRVLVLAPGEPDDADIYCWLLPCDLDWDYARSPPPGAAAPPRPVESLSFATASIRGDDGGGDGAERRFPIHVDMDMDVDAERNPRGQRMHPFQRYDALSYVWGQAELEEEQEGEKQQQRRHIFLDGEPRGFPVTQNLYAALRSLRLRRGGRRLWVDALCINQGDYEEKERQLALVRRVYAQAERVIAFLPLPPRDQENIRQLVVKILQAGKLHMEREEKDEKTGSEANPNRRKEQLPLSDWDVVTVTREDENEPFSTTASRPGGPVLDRRGRYIEDFAELPREDSPLWDSWRALWSAPYFRRIWILQEMALGRNPRFCFGGDGGVTSDAELLFAAREGLDLYSGAVNMGYTIAPGRRRPTSHAEGDGDQEEKATRAAAMVGSQNAAKMFHERVMARRGTSATRLIDMLATVTRFQATDARDKIYALLGLTCDGTFFAQHVSYAPWDTAAKTFAKFARLFVERNEGIEVLLQAGLRGEGDDEWPSWVPPWDAPFERHHEVEAAKSPGELPLTMMRVDEDSRTLYVSKVAILDTIKVVNDSVFEKLNVSPRGVGIEPFIRSLTAGCRMILAASSSRDIEDTFESLFHVLAQPKPACKKPAFSSSVTEAALPATTTTITTEPQDSTDDAPGPSSAPSQSAEPSGVPDQQEEKEEEKEEEEEGEEHDEEHRALRTGFHELLNYIIALSKVDPSEGVYRVLLANSPEAYYSFLRRAMKTTGHRRFCVTEDGHVGLVPKSGRVGDRVVVFGGSPVHFVLRPVLTNRPGEGGGGGGEIAPWTYRLVGPAYFHIPKTEDGRPFSTALRQDIMIL